MNATPDRNSTAYPYVKTWLWLVALLLVVIVIVGGATRLTDSGLSITEWRPLVGVVPPLTDAAWQEAFAKYQQIPEFHLQNSGMSLAEFKVIFWWEWAHRLLGRVIGLAVALPFLALLFLRRIGWHLALRLSLILVLGGLQGALGWYMVASGLADRLDVSQYRLAAHLTLASVILAMIVWTALGVGRQRRPPGSPQEWLAALILALIVVQVAAGGFAAGLDAGMGFNTWPLMEGRVVPSGLLVIEPAWRNLFENALTVQFNHRLLAYLILILMAWHAWSSFRVRAWVLLYVAFIQAILGIWTLLWRVPLPLALLHQANAMALLCLAVWNLSGILALRKEVSGERTGMAAASTKV